MRLVRYSLMILRSLVVSFALCAPAAACKVDLDIAGHTGESGEVTEDSPGAVVVRQADDNKAPRKRIILRWKEYTGHVILGRNVAAITKVSVFEDVTGGEAITFDGEDNKFPHPGGEEGNMDLWVQGDAGSATMKDVILSLKRDGQGTVDDDVRFTVLWVPPLTSKYSGTLTGDNAIRDYWKNKYAVPADYNLGEHLLICNDMYPWWGYVVEFKGQVLPSDFDPTDFDGDLYLAREKTDLAHYYYGPNGNEYSFTTPAGDDTSDATLRDENPEPNGNIYDIDAPGLSSFRGYSANTIFRLRINYREWATWDTTRCSERRTWYTAQSVKKTGTEDTGTATGGGANTLQDTNKEWIENSWKFVKITGGTGPGQVRLITGNTANTITIRENWAIVPDNTSEYHLLTDTTWTKVEDVTGDNKTEDGQLSKLTWDLQ